MISQCASVVGFQPLVFLFIQIQQDDCSAAWPILCAVLLLHRPVTPNAENNCQTDCAGNPLHPTSTGKLQVCQPLPLHSVINSSYLALFCSLALPHISSQGMVNSMMMIFFIAADHKTMSGLKFVGTISGNLSFLSSFTSCCQSLAWSKIRFLVLLLMFPLVVSPSLTNCICIGFFFRVLTYFRCFSITSANSRSTLLCRRVYLLCDKAMAHDESTCCWVPRAPHRGQSGVSVSFHL